MKKTWLLLFAAMLLPVALLAKTTTIYHTSDVHGFSFRATDRAVLPR